MVRTRTGIRGAYIAGHLMLTLSPAWAEAVLYCVDNEAGSLKAAP
jgi:hypothetical protein